MEVNASLLFKRLYKEEINKNWKEFYKCLSNGFISPYFIITDTHLKYCQHDYDEKIALNETTENYKDFFIYLSIGPSWRKPWTKCKAPEKNAWIIYFSEMLTLDKDDKVDRIQSQINIGIIIGAVKAVNFFVFQNTIIFISSLEYIEWSKTIIFINKFSIESTKSSEAILWKDFWAVCDKRKRSTKKKS